MLMDMAAVTSQEWTPRNHTQQAAVEYSVNHIQTEALRILVPDSGAYINEVCLSSFPSFPYFPSPQPPCNPASP